MTAILERESIEETTKQYEDPSKGPSICNHEGAYKLLNQLLERFPDVGRTNYLPNFQIRELEAERRSRRVEIQSLQRRLEDASLDDRGELVYQLQNLSNHQFATRMFRGLIHENLTSKSLKEMYERERIEIARRKGI